MCSNLLSHHFVLSFCLLGNSLLVSLVNVVVLHDIEVSCHDGFPCRHGRYGSGSFPGGGKKEIHGESIEDIGFFHVSLNGSFIFQADPSRLCQFNVTMIQGSHISIPASRWRQGT